MTLSDHLGNAAKQAAWDQINVSVTEIHLSPTKMFMVQLPMAISNNATVIGTVMTNIMMVINTLCPMPRRCGHSKSIQN